MFQEIDIGGRSGSIGSKCEPRSRLVYSFVCPTAHILQYRLRRTRFDEKVVGLTAAVGGDWSRSDDI